MTIEEKRRELFEAWQGEKADKERYRRGPCAGMYKNPVMQNGWKCFNAALDAVVIPLPEKCDVEEWSESFITFRGEGYSKELIIEAIESTGLGLKVKP